MTRLLPAVLAALSACATYSAAPLPEDTLATSLQVPSQDALRVLISELPNPLQASVVLNFDDGLGPDEAAVLAVVLNPYLKALRAGRGVSSAELLIAGLLPEPSLALGADVPTGGITTGAVTGYVAGLDWAISDLIGRSARRDVAQAEAASLDLDILWQESLVAGRVRGIVCSLGALREARRFVDGQIAIGEADVTRVEAAVGAGQLTAMELAAQETSLATSRASRVQLDAEDAAMTLELATAIGLPPGIDIEVQVVEGFQGTSPRALPELLGGLEARRLDLMALRRGYESQEERVRVAILGQIPRVSLGPVFNRDTGDLQTLGLGLAIDLPIFGRSKGEIALQRATRTAMFAEYTARVNEARASIASAVGRFDALRLQLKVLRDQQALQESLVARLRAGLDQGYVDVLTLNQTQRDLFDLQIATTRAVGDLQAAAVLIEVISGQPGSLTPPQTDERGLKIPGSEQI